MKYEICLVFQNEDNIGLSEVRYIIDADSFESAFKCALTMKDTDWPEQKLKDINVYNQE